MRAPLSSLVLAVAVSTRAAAAPAPAADLVFVWAPPGTDVAPITAAAQRAGAAVLDRSPIAPAPSPADAAAPLVRRGIEAYDALRFDDALVAFDHAREAADRTGAADLTTAQLADLWLYRGLTATQRGDATTAWDDLVEAAAIAPDRVLDPARFPPRVIEQFERARAAIAAGKRVELAVTAPADCAITVDGMPLVPHAQLAPAAHWVRVACRAHAPWGARVEVAAPATTITAAVTPYAPLDAADMLIQARTAGARAFVVAELHGTLATAKLVGVDGREQDRRSVTIAAGGDLAPFGAALDALLARTAAPATPHHWYQTRWAWAAGAAVAAAAVLVPLTAVLVHDDRATAATLQFKVPWSP